MSHKLPRRAIASVISRLAKHQLPGNKWPELLQCMSTCAAHQSEHLREVSVLLVYQQYETIGEGVQDIWTRLQHCSSQAEGHKHGRTFDVSKSLRGAY